MYSEAELERLGRMRPTIFPNLLSELGFCFSLVLSQIMAVSFSRVSSVHRYRHPSWGTYALTCIRNTSFPASMFSSPL